MTDDSNTIDATRDVLCRLVAGANGGTLPESFDIRVADGDAQIMAYNPHDGRTKLFATIRSGGRLDVTVGMPTSWTTLCHDGFQFARTGGGQLILLGRHAGKRMHFSIDEDRLWADLGSPLVSVAAEEEAMAAFDRELAALVAEAR